MVLLDQSESSLRSKEMENSPTKRILALPNSNKRQAWESLVESASKSVDSNEELKSSLQRIGQAEKIPLKWNRLQKSQFMTFLNSVGGYQVNPTIDEQSWELFSKALEDRRKNQAKNANNQENKMEATTNVPSVEKVYKRKSDGNPVSGNKKLRKEIEASDKSLKTEKSLCEENKKMAKKLAKKQAQQEKKKMIKAEWQSVIQSVIPEVGNNEALVNDLQAVRNAPNIPLETKWSCLIRPHFMTFLMNIPGYTVNPTTTNELWTLVSKALKKNHESKTAVKTQVESVKVPKVNKRREAWVAMLKNIIMENTDSTLTSNLEKISQAVKVPRYLNKLTQQKFMNFLTSIPEYQTNPAVDKKLWNLFSKALNERQKSIAQNLNADATKEGKNGIKTENQLVSENGNKKKRKHQTEESKSQVNGTNNQVDDTPILADQTVKIKWSAIGKQILRVQDDNELPLKKFQEKIVKDYLKQIGGSGDNESVDALWLKCHQKLSKNPKFQIDGDKIKLVS